MSHAPGPVPNQTEPRMLTRSTILILSGWLVGTATANMVPEGVEQFATLVGLLGLIAFTGLDHGSR